MRPIVLVATTDPAIAIALQAILDVPCRKLGLRLDICTGGREEKTSGGCTYDSAEALFDHLEQCAPLELADTLVVICMTAEDLPEAFNPSAPLRKKGWHITGKRAGVAVELLLRFPQVFPVFLSIDAPVLSTELERNKVVEPKLPRQEESRHSFRTLLRDLRKRDCRQEGEFSTSEDIPRFDELLALSVPLHFVSPLTDDGCAGLYSTLARFARGMRCWFDPTGLRTLVRNRFLGTLFGKQTDWDKTREQRHVLLNRLHSVAVAVDEEREFALINAYAAYKFGRRAWLVTTFAEFDDKPLWVASATPGAPPTDVVVLRDIDLRFPDIPNEDPSSIRKEALSNDNDQSSALREQLRAIASPVWQRIPDGNPRLGSGWRVRAVTSHIGVEEHSACTGTQQNGVQDGVMANGRLCGLAKPISSLYELRKLLLTGTNGQQSAPIVSIGARIVPVKEEAGGHHGAPYLNLAMAESLLYQAGRCEHGPIENLLGAFLAGEAYELLLGMSQTTALKSLLMQHKHEVVAEGEFPGVSQTTDIENRKGDVEATVKMLLALNDEESQERLWHKRVIVTKDKSSDTPQAVDLENRRQDDRVSVSTSNAYRCQKQAVADLFLVKFWTELKLAYRSRDQFHAAEAANAQSLIHSDWLSGFPRLRTVSATTLPTEVRRWIKERLVRVATSFSSWIIATFLSVLLSASLYGIAAPPEKLKELGKPYDLLLSTILSTITLQPTALISKLLDDKPSPPLQIVATFHMGFSYLLFGVLIAMLYRKITRG